MADEEMTEEVGAEAPEAAEAGADDVAQGLENVAEAAEGVAEAVAETAAQVQSEYPTNLNFILDVALQISVEVGRARMTIQDLLQLGQGSVVELEKLAGESLDIYVNGKLVAKGEAVIVNEKFGVRITEIDSPQNIVEGLA